MVYRIWTIELNTHYGQHISIYKEAHKHIVIHILWLEKFFSNDENIPFKISLFLCIINKRYFHIKKWLLHDGQVIVDLLYMMKKQNKNFLYVLGLIVEEKKTLQNHASSLHQNGYCKLSLKTLINAIFSSWSKVVTKRLGRLKSVVRCLTVYKK